MQDKKITSLPELTSVEYTDISLVVDSPSGVPVTKYSTTQNIVKGGASQGAVSGVIDEDLTANKAVVTDSSGKIIDSTVSDTEVSYLEGASSNIQDQIDSINKLTTKGDLLSYNGSSYVRLGSGTYGQILVSDSNATSGIRWVDKYNPNYETYCVNKGNVDAYGYPDIISKVSDTEVMFKVGDVYPNMEVTFPNGNHYTISSVENVTGLSSDGTHTFIIEEDSLTYLGDDTFSAVAIATLQADSTSYQTPIMTSNTAPTGYIVSGTYNDPSYPIYKMFDRNNTTTGLFSANGDQTGVYVRVQYATARIVNSYYFKPLYGSPTGWDIKASNDGSSWTTLLSVTGQSVTSGDEIYGGFQNETEYTYYELVITSASGTQLMHWRSLDFLYNNRIERITTPSNPSIDDYLLVFSGVPYESKKYNGAIWVDTQFIKVGKAEKVGGYLDILQSYAFNGRYTGYTGLESNVGSDSIVMNTQSGSKLIKRAF